jgi:putative transposase
MRRAIYPSDLTDAPWKLIRPLLPKPKPGARPRTVNLRAILNGLFDIVPGGVHWRMLPHDFPPGGTVHYSYWKGRREGTWATIQHALRTKVRHQNGRHQSPSVALLDSPTVKTTAMGGPRGSDSAPRLQGRKRHLVVDTLGLLWAVVVPSAGLQDRDGAKLVLEKLQGRFSRLKVIWADGADAAVVDWAKVVCGWVRELVRKPEGLGTFQVLPRRGVVERTFGGLNRGRRLSQDSERDTGSSEAMIRLAMLHLMLKRLCHA